MLPPKKPADENGRLASLRSLGVLDTVPEERFDRITRIAKRLFDVPIALVSLVDEDRQWFKSRQGLEAFETPRDISFCGHAILSAEIFVIPDALEDERFRDNPLVLGPPNIRFYAGRPLTLSNGERIGTLCIIDRVPRQLNDEDAAMLDDLAQVVERELSALRLACVDELTELCNRRGFENLASHALELCRRLDESAFLLYFDLDGFKRINDSFGHLEGDQALREFARALTETFRSSDVVGRIGGDEFAVLVSNASSEGTGPAVRRLEGALDSAASRAARAYDVRFSVGTIGFDSSRHRSIAELMKDADKLMYLQKKGGSAGT